MPFAGDHLLTLMQLHAEEGNVLRISGGLQHKTGWQVWLPPDLIAEVPTVEACATRMAKALGTADGTPLLGETLLCLDWLVERGIGVFLKADGERPRVGWTFLCMGGMLPPASEHSSSGFLRADGPTGQSVLRAMLPKLALAGVRVPC